MKGRTALNIEEIGAKERVKVSKEKRYVCVRVCLVNPCFEGWSFSCWSTNSQEVRSKEAPHMLLGYHQRLVTHEPENRHQAVSLLRLAVRDGRPTTPSKDHQSSSRSYCEILLGKSTNTGVSNFQPGLMQTHRSFKWSVCRLRFHHGPTVIWGLTSANDCNWSVFRHDFLPGPAGILEWFTLLIQATHWLTLWLDWLTDRNFKLWRTTLILMTDFLCVFLPGHLLHDCPMKLLHCTNA